MRNFRDDRSRGRRDSYGGNPSDRDSRRASMHDTVCDECGKDCQVPFKPSGDKPIYCSNCFEKKGGGNSRRSNRRDSGRSSGGNTNDHNISKLTERIEILNTKLDTIIDLLSADGKKKSDSKKSKPKKDKKIKDIPEESVVFEKKDADTTVDTVQEIVEPKDEDIPGVDPLPEIEPTTTEEPQQVDEPKLEEK